MNVNPQLIVKRLIEGINRYSTIHEDLLSSSLMFMLIIKGNLKYFMNHLYGCSIPGSRDSVELGTRPHLTKIL